MNKLTRAFLSKKDREALDAYPEAKAALTLVEEAKALAQRGATTGGGLDPTGDILRSALVGQGMISVPTFQDTQSFIEEGFNANSTIYSIITNTSKKFSTIPWYLSKVKSSKKAAMYKAATSGDWMTPAGISQALILKEQAFDEVESHPALSLWNKPNAEQSGPEFRESALAFKMLTGGTPIYCQKGASGVKPLSVVVLPTQFVQLWVDPYNIFKIGNATFNITGAMIPIEVDQLLYWKYFNPNFSVTGQHLYGQAPLRAAYLNMCADNQNTKAQEFMFRHTGVPGLFVPDSLDTAVAANDQSDQIRTTLADLFAAREVGTVAATYANNPLKYIPFGMTAEELKLIEAARLTAERLCNVWNYPPALITQERTTDNNYQNAVKYLVTNTIYADLCSFRDNYANDFYLKQWGLNPAEWFMDFDISVLPEMQEDMQKQAEALSRMDYITPNEKRAIQKFDKREGPEWDTAYMSAGLVPIDAAFAAGSGDMPEDVSIL